MIEIVENDFLKWNIDKKVLPLRFNWKISRNNSVEKTNFFIRVTNGIQTGIGEVAPNIRYGETGEIIENHFKLFIEKYQQNYLDLDNFEIFLDSLVLPHSLRFGIESAFVHFICQKNNIKPADFFQLQLPQNVATSFSVPILEINEIKNFIEPLKRFKSLKLKVNQEMAFDIINEVSKYSRQKLYIDGNEAWEDVNLLIKFLNNIRDFNIEFIEQPMPSKFIEEYKYLKKNCPFTLIADESIEDSGDFNLLKQQFHGINMKLMKAGGYKNGIKILENARQNGLKTMIGCMVETSLGIYSAFNLANNVDYLDLDGFLIIRDDPFELVKEENGFLYISEKGL